MANTGGGSADYFASPLNAVFGSTGPQHEKALKHAFYNTAALVFVILSGVIAVVVYYVLEAFIRPLLWAVLCGAFLHPFQRTATSTVRSWLKSLHETDTPFAIGFAFLPFKIINESSDVFGKLLKANFKLILTLAVLFPVVYYLIVFQPFLQIFIAFENMIIAISTVLEIFQRPLWVWTLLAGYIVIVIFWWTPTSANVLSKLSLPVWTLLFIHLVSYAGKWKVLIFLMLLILVVVGLYEEWKEKNKRESKVSSAGQVESVDGTINDEEPALRNILMKSLTVIGLASMSQSELVESGQEKKEQAQMPNDMKEIDNNDDKDSKDEGKAEKDNEDFFDGKTSAGTTQGSGNERAIGKFEDSFETEENIELKARHKSKARRKSSTRKEASKKRTGKSDPYFIALFWLFLISRIWLHTWILQFVPVLMLIYLAKTLFLWMKAPEFFSERYSCMIGRCGQWTMKRKDAIVPVPVRGVYKLLLKGDKQVIKWTDKSMEKLMTILIMLCLLVFTTLSIVFLAFQVQQESVYMARLVNNAVNETLTTNPELFRWLPENTDVKEAFDNMVHRVYIHGRKWMVEKLNSMLRGNSSNSTVLEKHMTSFVDNLYHQWLSRNSSQQLTKSSQNATATITKRASFSLDNVKKLVLGSDTFDNGAMFSLVKENVDTLKALFESVWSILKGNVNLALSLITTVFSVIFFSGTYILNTGLSSIVFLTALFYLLSSSGSQYKVVEWISGLSMGTRFSESVNIAVTDVFGATLKMAIFYGFYTWMTHSIFGLNIVFIPSALAAMLAAIPIFGTYFAAVPGALELWLVHNEELFAILLIILHFLPTYVVDIAIYSEITGGGHPYLTGLAVAGGMYWFSLEGAIIGPIVLCCLVAAFNIYNGIFTEDKSERPAQFRAIRQYDYTLQRTPLLRHIRRTFSEER